MEVLMAAGTQYNQVTRVFMSDIPVMPVMDLERGRAVAQLATEPGLTQFDQAFLAPGWRTQIRLIPRFSVLWPEQQPYATGN
jgi:hypothetical protein